MNYLKGTKTWNYLADHFDKEMRKENLPYIEKKLHYYKTLYESLSKKEPINDYDLENLIKFESELKKQKKITMDEFLNIFDTLPMALHLEGMYHLADNVLKYDYEKLFKIAQYNDNIASMIRIEHEFNTKLDRVMKKG